MSISPCVASATNVDSGYVSYNTTGYSHTMHHTYNNDNTVLSSHYNYVSKSGNTVKSDILCIYAHNEVTGYKYAEIKYGGATYTSGGATGQIGDPKDNGERDLKTLDEVEHNKACIKAQIERVINSDNVTMVDNYDWYKGTSAIEFLRDIAINFRVPQMLAKESVKKRLEASEGALTFTEFSYQILQGNDFLHLYDNYGCQMEVGGADQWGNITAGTDLVHRMRGKTAYGLTFPLLLDSTGKKFGKSEGNALFLNGEMTPVFDWYQYFLRTPDADVIRYLKVFSMKSLDEIAALEAEMKAHPEARIPQKALAEELTRLVHGEEGLKKAQEATEALYSKKSSADVAKAENVPSAQVKREDCVGKPVFAVAAAAGMFKSNGEARRMAQQGGLSLNDAKVDDKRLFAAEDVTADGVAVLRSGKKNYFVLKF